MHILVVSQYFYPEKFRINDICFEWIRRGYQVTVLTGIPNYPKGKFYKGYGLFMKRNEIVNGVKVIRIPIIPRKNSNLFLTMNYFSFVISGWFWKLTTSIRADIVFNFEVSPMTQALPGIWYANKRKIPFIIYVQDLWPDSVEIVGKITNTLVISNIKKMVSYIYNHASLILTTSTSFRNAICSSGVPFEKVIFWPQYAEDFYYPHKDFSTHKDFVVVYTGNIGRAQGLEILPEMALKLKNEFPNNNVKFRIVGDGRNKETLERLIESYAISEMFQISGQINPEEIPQVLAESDIAFMSLSSDKLFRMTIPAKLQTYLACGMPVLAAVQGESRIIIEESKTGLCSDPSDVEGAYQNLLRFWKMSHSDIETMSKNGIKYVESNFNKTALMNQLDSLLKKEWKNVQR